MSDSKISGRQLRAARVFLGLTIGQLATGVGVGRSTILRAEAADHLRGNLHGRAIRDWLKAQGIEFLAAGDAIPNPAMTLPE